MFTHYNATPVIILSILDMMFAGLLAPCTISDGRKILSTSHGYLYDTGVDKGGPEGPGPPIAGQKRIFFVKIEGLVEPVVLNLSFRVRSNAMFTSERRY